MARRDRENSNLSGKLSLSRSAYVRTSSAEVQPMRHVPFTRIPGSSETVPIYIAMMRRALHQGRKGDKSGAAETLTTAAKIMSRCDDPRAAQVARWARDLARAS